jgi:hypothetical protein
VNNQKQISKPTLFIGSSSESKALMREIQTIMSEHCDVKPWDKDIFHVGGTTLESLRREVLLSDFALLILYPDDQIIKRDEGGYTTRDNILFELGLFMGVLGPKRAFWLLVTDKRGGMSKEVLIPSDIEPLTRLNIQWLDENTFEPDLQIICDAIKAAIEREENQLAFTMLPSTALAIGYYKNFVLEVCKALLRTSDYELLDGRPYDFTLGKFNFYIVLPDKGAESGHAGYDAFLRNRGLTQIEIRGGADGIRRFPFYIDSLPRNGYISLYDYPTTLRSSWEAIDYISRSTDISASERETVERREIVNFERTLRQLLDNSPEATNFKDKIKIVYLNELPAPPS